MTDFDAWRRRIIKTKTDCNTKHVMHIVVHIAEGLHLGLLSRDEADLVRYICDRFEWSPSKVEMHLEEACRLKMMQQTNAGFRFQPDGEGVGFEFRA